MNLRIKKEVSSVSTLKSFIFIKKKLDKKQLSEKEINEIIKDVVNNSLSEEEISIFVLAMYKHGMNMKEIIYLTKAILNSGNKLKLKDKFMVDKHSIGGIAGNRTTPIVVSICAATGLIVPKTSSRAITSAAGTADVIETIAKVNFSVSELKKILKKTNACMVWGGALNLVPADSKIIKIEKILKIDPEAQLLASIMSKKLAVGSKYILIDIPYGKSAKVTKLKALKLKKKFVYLGRYFNKKLKVVLTDGKEPIGNGIGPSLELIDVINVLDPEKKGPKDLEEKSLFLAGELLELTKKTKNGVDLAKKILYSGKAYNKFRQIIKAQGGSLKKIKLTKLRYDVLSKKSGKIIEIDNKKINSLVRIAGSPMDKSSGIYLYFHVGDRIKRREKILTIYAESKSRLYEAVKFFNKEKPIKIK
tara:strand:+ start:3310 stop:4563 length:1254 start_codon:yes stop_codon:yes gene_type:complete